MPFKKFAQIGRVIYINEGQYKGKLAVIVDIIDTNRALIDGPCHGVPRQQFKFCEMRLTTYVLKICRGMRTKLIRTAWEAAQITEKFEASSWNKNINKGLLRASMTDFDRFKLGRAKQAKNKIIKSAYMRLKKNIQLSKRPTVKAARTARKAKLAKKKEKREKSPKSWKPRARRGPRATRNKEGKPAKTVKAAK
ncbi:60S ribosomal protein L14-like [Penaeus japonicus]|uniref:60S ribosomal protein L14-like n=1 Tax=Penaeus japonicus TaxID=27405 RepID=UPI001C713838|nr:60S ribosomal protein L14-like [Penaeus japonicus]